ncbi:MAG TPA: hypothetical protein DDZ90_10085, partial [Planctomycetaceae bacterium]|nr:hypothetical protein [Planctomycetaceae bacterium]
PVTAPRLPPVIKAPAVQPETSATQQPDVPAYINDDPPPSPFTLQSYPYTPLPEMPTSAADRNGQQIDQINYSNRMNFSTTETLPDYRSRR